MPPGSDSIVFFKSFAENMLRIIQNAPQNGFLLESELQISSQIAVFMGKNGAGKTRLFQSLKNGLCTVHLDELELKGGMDIVVLSQSELTPHIAENYDETSHANHVRATIISYENLRETFDRPYDPQQHDLQRINRNGGLSPSQLHKLTQLIARKVNKRPSQLSQEDIRLHYEDPQTGGLAGIGGHDVAGVFNRYVRRLHANEFNQWLRSVKGNDVPSYTDVEFEAKFGKKPWTVINNIIGTVFEGKFHFPEPDVNSTTYNHRTPLLDDQGQPISIGELSSGERTLLWLALSLFNTQYHDRELLSPPKLLLLDEPDAFLHPKMVEKMYTALSEFNKQFGALVALITHSPTTVALAPQGAIYVVEPNCVKAADKDAAISQLLDGVPQLSIDPENRRQVYVESYYDSIVFQELFDHLKSRSSVIDPRISLTFISSGPKIPPSHIEQKVKQILGIDDEKRIAEFVSAVNGCGNCDQVYSAVEVLNLNGPTGVRGLVDWDTKNHPTKHVQVFGHEYAYAIENLILDPICVLLQVHVLDSLAYPLKTFCGAETTLLEWLEDTSQLQVSLDYFLLTVLGLQNARDETLRYRSEITVQTDRRHLLLHGHSLEKKIYDAFPLLNKIARPQRDGDLKKKIATNIMISVSSGKLIPRIVETTFSKLQS